MHMFRMDESVIFCEAIFCGCLSLLSGIHVTSDNRLRDL
jgi:hypothetical protein